MILDTVRAAVELDVALLLHDVAREYRNVKKSGDKAPADYQDRISALEKRLEAAVEEHRRMRRELEALEERDPYHILRTVRPFPHVDDDARN